jgi:uncharacterized membrane protein
MTNRDLTRTYTKRPLGVPDNGRIANLSDGLFSIVFTLLVLELTVPVIAKDHAAAELPLALYHMLPHLAGYALSFVVIGIYWVGQHNMFVHIKRHDRVLMWLNLLFLMCVGFMPFPVGLIVEYGQEQISVVVYAAVLVASGLALDLIWWYATHNRRLVDAQMDRDLVTFVHRRVLLAPALYLTAIVLSFASVDLAKVVFLVVALAYIVPNPLDHYHHAEVQRHLHTEEDTAPSSE